jgi:biopolymer transport protein ExbD
MAHGSGFKRKKQTAEDNEVDMTPMIDCIMLLLIFFMTTSKMSAAGAVPVPEAKSGGAVDPKKTIVISMFEGLGGKETEVVLGDGKPDGDLRPLAKSEDDVRQFIKKGREVELKTAVMIKAEEHVTARDVNRVARVVGEFDAMVLYLGVRGLDTTK